MLAPKNMPSYRSHKTVKALQIEDIKGFVISFVDKAFPPVTAEPALIARYVPLPGDYLVIYADGYQSISPAKAFEDGYTATVPVAADDGAIAWSHGADPIDPLHAGYRRLTGHVVNPVNDKLTIDVLDAPGAGGAHHHYSIAGFDTETNPSAVGIMGFKNSFGRMPVIFQNGPIARAGVNGITHEALLAILIDRLQSFENGPYACAENARALSHLRMAQDALLARTKARMARGVEGTHAV